VDEPVHPADLVSIFVRARRIDIGQINGCEAQHALPSRHHSFQEPSMAVGLIAGQSRRHLLERKLGEERDAVEGLLPVHRNIVAERLERLAWEGLIHALGLLQDNDVWPPLRKPSGQIVDPLLDGIDVPGRDAHLWWCKIVRCKPAGTPAPDDRVLTRGYTVFTTVPHRGMLEG